MPLNLKSIGKEFREACKIQGIEDLHFYDLRHEGCRRLVEQSFTIPEGQKVSLHDSWGSLERYVSVKRRKETLSLDNLLEFLS